jgi:hypothetical protein
MRSDLDTRSGIGNQESGIRGSSAHLNPESRILIPDVSPGLRAPGSRLVRPIDRTLAIRVLLLLVLAAPVAAQEMIDRVLAVVGGQVITLSDARAALEFGFVEPPPAGADPIRVALDEAIRRQLVLSEVERYSAPEPDLAVIDQRLAAVRGRFPSEDAFQAALARSGLNANGVRDVIRDTWRIEQYLRDRFSAVVQPTEEEVERYYAEHPSEFKVSYEAARQAIREALMLGRRNDVMTDWLDRLRRRADISDLYVPSARR